MRKVRRNSDCPVKTRCHSPKHFFAIRSARGLSLLETALVLAILAMVSVSIIRYMSDNFELARVKTVSDRISEVGDASRSFMTDNISQLLIDAPNAPDALVFVAGRPNAGSPPPAESLQERGFLPASFIDTNAYGQRHALLLQRNDSNGINALVTTYGGREIPDSILGRLASSIGAEGGFIPNTPIDGNGGQVLGVFGGWRTPVSNWGPEVTRPSPGHAALSLDISRLDLLPEVIFRNDIGNPEANRMRTDLDLSGNRISNVSEISGSSVLSVSGLLVSQDGISVEKGINIGESAGISGDLDVRGGVEISGESMTGGNFTVGGDLTASQALSADSLTVDRNADIGGTLSTEKIDSEELNIDSLVVDDSSGRTFNADVKLVDLLPKMVSQYTYQVTEKNNLVYKPTCAGGYENARIVVHPVSVATVGERDSAPSTGQSRSISVVNNRRYFWRVTWSGSAQGSEKGRAVANTYCFYD